MIILKFHNSSLFSSLLSYIPDHANTVRCVGIITRITAMRQIALEVVNWATSIFRIFFLFDIISTMLQIAARQNAN